MLLVALGVTVVGFILLIVALVTGTVWFAWACIGVCVIGFVLLVVDVFSGRRGGSGDHRSVKSGEPAGSADDSQPDQTAVEHADDDQAWSDHPDEGPQEPGQSWDAGGQAWSESEPDEGHGEYHSGYPNEEHWQPSNWESFEQGGEGRHHAAGSGDSGDYHR